VCSSDLKKRSSENALNALIPTVELGGSLIRSNTTSSISGTVVTGVDPAPAGAPIYDTVAIASYSQGLPQWHAAGSISASLALNAGLFEAMNALKLNYAEGQISYEKAKAQLERDVRKSYYSILLLTENITLMEGNLSAALRRVQQAEANFRAGLVPELTVLQAKVAAENLRPALAELNNAKESSLAAFAMTLGLPRGTKLALAGAAESSYVTLDANKLVQGASSQLDVLALKQSVAALESTRKATFFQVYTPTLQLYWNADPTLVGDPWKDSWLSSDGEQQSGMFRATLGFRLNGLLPMSSEAAGLKEMDDNIRKLNIALAQTIRGMELEIDSAVLKLEKSRTSAAALALNVELAERAYRLSEDAYKAGAKDLLDVQNAELELQKAKLEVLKEKFNYITGLLDLEYAVGVPFGTISGSLK
jgi:outer membrane protein TolC